ncbi:MAG: type IX secretion system sortase PorU [Candidatus Cloacimonetes bacterium]|nr:type IX secretion system sortase PorU [Candidatus Cloacimonadota bacterium]
MKRPIVLLIAMIAGNLLFGKVTLISTRGSEILVEYTIDDWKVEETGEFSNIVAAGMDFGTISGAPLLPLDIFKIGMPPAGDLDFSILESDKTIVTLSSKLMPVPTVSMKDGMSDYTYLIDLAKYADTRSELLSVSPVSFRGYSLVDFTIKPFVYDGQMELSIYRRLLIKITLQGDMKYRANIASDAITDVMLSQLVNAEQAKFWRNDTRAQVNYADFGLSGYWMRIETNRDGIHRLNYSQLSAFPLQDIDPRMFRMFSTSGKVISRTVVQPGPEFKEIPIQISNEASGVFGANDYILFYGSSRDGDGINSNVQRDPLYMNPYSQNQVFWLSFGNNFNGAPLRITMSNAETTYTEALNNTPAFKHVESEIHRREEDGFTWYSNRLFGNSTLSYPFQINLADVDTSGTQSLSLKIYQEDVSNTHRISVDVNGVLIKNTATGTTDFTWSGDSAYLFNRSHKGFVNGANSIKLNVFRGATDNLYFDWYRVSYRQNLYKANAQKLAWHQQTGVPSSYRYNLTGTLTDLMIFRANSIYDVQQIPLQYSYFVSTGTSLTRYLLLNPNEAYAPVKIELADPVDLTNDTSQADNVIITTAEFKAKAETLVQKYWNTYGIRSRVVLQDDIFNQFSGGHPDPVAIRQAIRYYYYNLPAPKLSSVTLIGIGTIDWRNYSGSSSAKNKLMVFQSDEIAYTVSLGIASDDFYAMINASNYPELAIGRYPVRSNAELDIMLQNFTNYTESPTPGWWRNSMVFIGDDLNNGPYTGEDIHTQQTEDAGNTVDGSILVDKIFAWEYEYDEFQNKPRVRNDMFAAINEGRLLWCYIGHGAYDALGAEDFLNGAVDMGRFANTGKLPFFIASSCKVSHFDYWGYDSLGEKLVLMNNIGAIASFGASRVSFPGSNQPLLLWLLEGIANRRLSLGASVLASKLRYQNASNNASYTLMGDPVLRVVPPERDTTMQVNAQSSWGTILHSRDTAIVEGSFSGQQLSGDVQLRAYNSQNSYKLGNIRVSHRGTQLFRGSSTATSSAYQAGFVVPDDVVNGDTGLVVSYFWDEANKKDYSNSRKDIKLSDQPVAGSDDDNDGPTIKMYLGSYDFRSGDTVNTSPTLYAKISDPHGVNITDANGHSILLVLDNSLQPIPITPYFDYDKGSFDSGTLVYQMEGLSEGAHTLQVIAFDNFNNPSVTTTTFIAKQSSALSIERLLIYPNPISKDGFITFMLSASTDVNIGIYTIRGKRIRNIQALGKQGFNSISFDGRDDKGAQLANNTYFVKVKAQSSAGKSVEKTEKLVIFK